LVGGKKAVSLLDTDEVGFPVQEVSGLIHTKSKLPQFTLFPTSLTHKHFPLCFVPPLSRYYIKKKSEKFFSFTPLSPFYHREVTDGRTTTFFLSKSVPESRLMPIFIPTWS